jgi:CDP-diacylglycerol---glycerol-3-phosphate 3-phosphatidyltransferase
VTARRTPGRDHAQRPSQDEAPRIRDVPGPRRNQSAIGPLFQALFAWPYRFGVAGLCRLGARAWHVTVASFLFNVAACWLLLEGKRFVPGLLLLPAGVLDILDGGVARQRGEAGRSGAFLDSVMDRVSDFIVFACLFWSLASQGNTLAAALALSSLAVSLMTSHIRAEAEAVGLSLTEGLFQRIERYVALMIGLTAPGALTPVLAILTALGGITVVQRLASIGKSDKTEARI